MGTLSKPPLCHLFSLSPSSLSLSFFSRSLSHPLSQLISREEVVSHHKNNAQIFRYLEMILRQYTSSLSNPIASFSPFTNPLRPVIFSLSFFRESIGISSPEEEIASTSRSRSDWKRAKSLSERRLRKRKERAAWKARERAVAFSRFAIHL